MLAQERRRSRLSRLLPVLARPRGALMSGAARTVLRSHEVSRAAHLAPRPASRRSRAVRRRSGGHPRGDRASRLRADRHDPRHRALAITTSSIRAFRDTGARTCAGAERRQERLRVLDACAVLRADPGHALLPRRDEGHARGRSVLVRRRCKGRPEQGARRSSAGMARSPSAISMTTCWSKRITPGRAASLRSGRCSSPSTAAS